ncbi:hypothetical protein F4693_002071 [Sphingomonas endophytica]|uniref:Uncharacterized protein n=1 Tax=Sphingomonas endophytica TaxID=869719 RepID=A0A7X0MN87_9SPHN|nr:hypothetical protein [Sphingomonas endophytica]
MARTFRALTDPGRSPLPRVIVTARPAHPPLVANAAQLQLTTPAMALLYKRDARPSAICAAPGVLGTTTAMKRVVRNKRLRHDLAAARRAQGMMSDPASLRTLEDYIAELEEQLYGNDTRFLVPVPALTPHATV